MEFKDLNSSAGLKQLDEHLATRSYITGFEPSQNDVSVFRSIPKDLAYEKDHKNVKRWYLHIKSFSIDQLRSLPQANEKVKVTPSQGIEVKYLSLEWFCEALFSFVTFL